MTDSESENIAISGCDIKHEGNRPCKAAMTSLMTIVFVAVVKLPSKQTSIGEIK